jgi:hypothetical protein
VATLPKLYRYAELTVVSHISACYSGAQLLELMNESGIRADSSMLRLVVHAFAMDDGKGRSQKNSFRSKHPLARLNLHIITQKQIQLSQVRTISSTENPENN